MKKRLPYIALFLISLILLGMSLFDTVTGRGLDIFQTIFGVYCLLFGGYKTVYPDKKE